MPSLAIKSYVYDESRNELAVIFATGRGYVYSLVPPDVFAAFDAVASKGGFHNQYIRDRYPFRKAKVATDAPGARSSLRDALIESGIKDDGAEVASLIPVRRG